MAVLAAMAVACAGLHGNKLSLMSQPGHVDHVRRGSGRTRRMNKIYTIINKESEKLLLIIIWEKIPPPREPDPG